MQITGSRSTWLVAAALVLGSLVLGSIALRSYWLDEAPGREMPVVGTTWDVIEIDGRAIGIDPAPSVSFDDQVDVTLWTGCREAKTGYGLDTDGNALTFGPVQLPADPSCADLGRAAEATFLEAINGTEIWSIDNADKVRFTGMHEIVLERRPAG
jgi:heat shock protein HslJ